jgi:hypothetical protein
VEVDTYQQSRLGIERKSHMTQTPVPNYSFLLPLYILQCIHSNQATTESYASSDKRRKNGVRTYIVKKNLYVRYSLYLCLTLGRNDKIIWFILCEIKSVILRQIENRRARNSSNVGSKDDPFTKVGERLITEELLNPNVYSSYSWHARIIMAICSKLKYRLIKRTTGFWPISIWLQDFSQYNNGKNDQDRKQ